MRTLIRDGAGEPSVWWSWQDLRRDHYKGKGTPHGRAWLHWPGNSIRIEWSLFGRSCGIAIDCADTVTDDDALDLHLAVPFLFSIWFSIRNVGFVERLPGVNWEYSDSGSGRRTISVRFDHWGIWWRLWRNPHISDARDWRDKCFYIDDFFLGRRKYSEIRGETVEIVVPMPECNYPATLTFVQRSWKRPRWYKTTTCTDADVEMLVPIPVPGKGENSWDCDDDELFGMNCVASTVEEAIAHVQASVFRDRNRYGGEGWKP